MDRAAGVMRSRRSKPQRAIGDGVIPDGTIKGANILLVDDEETNLHLLERMLRRTGYTRLTSTTDPRAAADLFAQVQPDLVVLDLQMPELSGLQVMERLESQRHERGYLPILVITGDLRAEPRLQALLLGANDFLTRPFEQFEVMLRIRNLLETRFLFLELQRENVLLRESLRSQASPHP